MSELIKYIKQSLGLDIVIVPLDKQQLKSLPLYITASYSIEETTLMGKRICLLKAKGLIHTHQIYFIGKCFWWSRK